MSRVNFHVYPKRENMEEVIFIRYDRSDSSALLSSEHASQTHYKYPSISSKLLNASLGRYIELPLDGAYSSSSQSSHRAQLPRETILTGGRFCQVGQDLTQHEQRDNRSYSPASKRRCSQSSVLEALPFQRQPISYNYAGNADFSLSALRQSREDRENIWRSLSMRINSPLQEEQSIGHSVTGCSTTMEISSKSNSSDEFSHSDDDDDIVSISDGDSYIEDGNDGDSDDIVSISESDDDDKSDSTTKKSGYISASRGSLTSVIMKLNKKNHRVPIICNDKQSDHCNSTSLLPTQFPGCIQAGYCLLVYCTIEKIWLPSRVDRVTRVDGGAVKCGADSLANDLVRVHFINYNKKWDEVLPRDSIRMAPKGAALETLDRNAQIFEADPTEAAMADTPNTNVSMSYKFNLHNQGTCDVVGAKGITGRSSSAPLVSAETTTTLCKTGPPRTGEFPGCIRAEDSLLVYCPIQNMWLPAKVVSVTRVDGSALTKEVGSHASDRLRIHYKKFNKKWDEILPRDSVRIASVDTDIETLGRSVKEFNAAPQDILLAEKPKSCAVIARAASVASVSIAFEKKPDTADVVVKGRERPTTTKPTMLSDSVATGSSTLSSSSLTGTAKVAKAKTKGSGARAPVLAVTVSTEAHCRKPITEDPPPKPDVFPWNISVGDTLRVFRKDVHEWAKARVLHIIDMVFTEDDELELELLGHAGENRIVKLSRDSELIAPAEAAPHERKGYLGVFQCDESHRFYAMVTTPDGRSMRCAGLFDSTVDAAIVYDNMIRLLYGPDGVTNFQPTLRQIQDMAPSLADFRAVGTDGREARWPTLPPLFGPPKFIVGKTLRTVDPSECYHSKHAVSKSPGSTVFGLTKSGSMLSGSMLSGSMLSGSTISGSMLSGSMLSGSTASSAIISAPDTLRVCKGRWTDQPLSVGDDRLEQYKKRLLGGRVKVGEISIAF